MLTPKRQRFAKLVATGMPKVDAHIAVYGQSDAKRKSRSVNASKLAADPDVKAKIQEYVDEMLPIGDMRDLRERMMVNMQHLALSAQDERVRLAASRTLHDIADGRIEREDNRVRTLTIDGILSEISELDQPQQVSPQLELESETDSPQSTENASDSPIPSDS